MTKKHRFAAWRGRPLRTGAGLALCAACAPACGGAETHHLDPLSVALSADVEPIYDDGELSLYEAKRSVMLPIVAPGAAELEALGQGESDPFERRPWVSRDDLELQITWTLSNLDAETHDVWVMVEPWNEFGRYVPALQVEGDEVVRDLSGIDMLFLLPGLDEPESPRLTGTFTYDDMAELALDFATVFKILEDAAPLDAEADDPRGALVNHAFNVRNRSADSPLLAPYRPAVVPGLVGFDFGIRSFEPVNVALEIAVEVRDLSGERVADSGQTVPLLEPPEVQISVNTP